MQAAYLVSSAENAVHVLINNYSCKETRRMPAVCLVSSTEPAVVINNHNCKELWWMQAVYLLSSIEHAVMNYDSKGIRWEQAPDLFSSVDRGTVDGANPVSRQQQRPGHPSSHHLRHQGKHLGWGTVLVMLERTVSNPRIQLQTHKILKRMLFNWEKKNNPGKNMPIFQEVLFFKLSTTENKH